MYLFQVLLQSKIWQLSSFRLVSYSKVHVQFEPESLYPHCNPLQGSTAKYSENPVMKTGTLQ